MVHPWRIFLIFLCVIAIFLALIFLFPSGEIRITEGLAIKFFPKEALINPGRKEKVDITEIIETKGEMNTDTAKTVNIDTVATDSLKIEPADVIITKYKIQYPEGKQDVLHNFFEALDKVRQGKTLIRILHYGDSQIEGDRITSDLRHKFQTNENFGGCGAGMIPVRDVLQGRLLVRHRTSGNWTKYAIYQDNPQDPPHNLYSLMGSFFRFQPYPEEEEEEAQPDEENGLERDTFNMNNREQDTLNGDLPSADTLEPELDTYGWFELTQTYQGYSSSRSFQNYKLLYGVAPDGVTWKTVVNDRDTIQDQLPESNGFTMLQRPFNGNFESLGFHFEGEETPDIYGVSFDCNTGVAVDNLGMRGSAITNFTGIGAGHLASQIIRMNAKLVILQFGVNVVPYVTDDYRYYENMIYRQLIALKNVAPDISVLVIGVSDMARKEGTGFASYPNVELIRQAQKNAAFRAGVAFWDLYEAMGGKHSMISWVQNDPPYAEKDYTHFNPRGARIIGKMIYDAIMEEYYVYKKVIQP